MGRTSLATFAATALLTVAAADTAHAQQRIRYPWLFEGFGGAVFPSGTFGDLVKIGAGGGAMAGYRISPRVTLLGTFGGAYFGASEGGRGWINYFYIGSAAFTVTPSNAGYTAMIRLGAGGSTFKPDIRGSPSSTYFAVNGGLKFHYFFADQAGMVVNASANVALTDEELFGSSGTWTFPLTAGIVVRF